MSAQSASSLPESAPQRARFLRMSEVEQIVGLNKRTIQRMVKEESFPAPVRLHERSIGFVESEVDAWMDNKIEDRSQ